MSSSAFVDRFVAGSTVSRLVLIALPGLAALAIFAAWHLANTGFWYDETMQFWISRGLEGFSPPLTAPGGFWATVRSNQVVNLDPGGFTLILRYWLLVSTGESWQRLLPLLFFVAGMSGMGWIGWQQRRSVRFAVFSGVVPALFPLMLDYATEVRAYSMEFAGVAICCALFERLTRRPSAPLALLVGLAFSFFMTSRYGFCLFTCAACVTFIGWIWQRGDGNWRSRLRMSACFCGPIAVMGALIFAFALWPQYKARISYNGGVLVNYLADMTATAKPASEIARMLAVNLLHPAGLPLTIAAALGLVLLLPARVRAICGLQTVATEIDRSGIAGFALLGLAALAVAGLVWHWHPWAIATKWSLWLQDLSAVAVVRLSAALLSRARGNEADLPRDNRMLATLMLVAILALDLRLALYRRPVWPNFVPALAYLETQSLPAGSVTMDVHTYPTVRYFYEYGSFKSSRNYPGAFRMPYWDGPKPLIAPETSLVLTGLSLADANAAFAPAKLVRDPGLPDQLFRVEPPTANAPR